LPSRSASSERLTTRSSFSFSQVPFGIVAREVSKIASGSSRSFGASGAERGSARAASSSSVSVFETAWVAVYCVLSCC
jgi:hypothetical protein